MSLVKTGRKFTVKAACQVGLFVWGGGCRQGSALFCLRRFSQRHRSALPRSGGVALSLGWMRDSVRRLLCFLFLALVLGLWDLSSPTRDQTQAPCVGSLESEPLATREVPAVAFSRRNSHHMKFTILQRTWLIPSQYPATATSAQTSFLIPEEPRAPVVTRSRFSRPWRPLIFLSLDLPVLGVSRDGVAHRGP